MRVFTRVMLSIGCGTIVLGILLVIIGFSTGATKRIGQNSWKGDTTTIKGDYQGVEKLDFDIDYGKIIIEESDFFSVEAGGIVEDDFTSIVEDGVWKIRYHYDNGFWPFHFGSRSINDSVIKVTIPKGFSFEELNMKLGAGELIIDSIQGKKMVYDLGAGKAEIQILKVEEELRMKVGAGEIKVEEIEGTNVTLDCGAGSMKIAGKIVGESKVNCGVGAIDLKLIGRENDYNYSAKSGIGKVHINGKGVSGFGSWDSEEGNDTKNSFRLTCGVGAITVNISE